MSSNSSLPDFLNACGATGPVELDLEDTVKHEVVRRVIHQPFIVLGRDSRSDLQLDDRGVSRRHAYLQVIGGNIYCIDLHSRTRLHWAHGPSRFGWLTPAQAVGVGRFNIRLAGGIPASALNPFQDWNPLATLPAGLGFPQAVFLESLDASLRPVKWRMKRGLALVGQSDDCNLCIREGGVSRYCCCLVNTPAGVWVVDLLGRPGAIVNDKPVRWAYLHDGDSFRVGGMVLRVRHEGARPNATPSPTRSLVPRNAATKSLVPKTGHRAPSNPITQPSPTQPLSSTDYPGLTAGTPMGGNDAAASLLGPLASQFAQMQQQMFDQFMQALLAMGQMFGQLQRDQLDLIREELSRVQQVNQDLQMLHLELARREPGNSGRVAARPAETTRPELEAGAQLSIPEGNGARESSPSETPTVAKGDSQLPTPLPVPESPEKSDWRRGKSAEEVHEQLSQRVLALQQEREGLWQQLLNRLLGRRSGETPQ
jgi:pSer/pThr/pTyr-binding forkhead associated (FHA) protein